MRNYTKLIFCIFLFSTTISVNAQVDTQTLKKQSNRHLEIMTRPFESASETKIFRKLNNAIAPKFTGERTKVLIHQMKGYGQDTALAIQAAELLEKVINSEEFKNTVINNTYHERRTHPDEREHSPQEIYDLIMKAHEPVGPGGSDNVIDLYLRVISEDEDGAQWMRNCDPGSAMGTIGIDGAGSGIAAVCPQWLRSTAQQHKPSWLAAHFIHEYMHVLGFEHNHRKPKSVPYKIQYIVEQLGAQDDPK